MDRCSSTLPIHARRGMVAYLRVRIVAASDAPGDKDVAIVESVDKKGIPYISGDHRSVYYVPYDELIPARIVADEMGVTT